MSKTNEELLLETLQKCDPVELQKRLATLTDFQKIALDQVLKKRLAQKRTAQPQNRNSWPSEAQVQQKFQKTYQQNRPYLPVNSAVEEYYGENSGNDDAFFNNISKTQQKISPNIQPFAGNGFLEKGNHMSEQQALNATTDIYQKHYNSVNPMIPGSQISGYLKAHAEKELYNKNPGLHEELKKSGKNFLQGGTVPDPIEDGDYQQFDFSQKPVKK